ncbi:MAG: hypothetical protein F6K42_31465 [Leptolyngbya sp. SIO1D8]|nr:hypothetical protein [Leptolyngbya sp. SIO1D8]
MHTQAHYDAALEALENKAIEIDDPVIDLQDERDRLARILAALIRQLRPDLIVLYADDEVPMVASLLAEFGEDGLIEELIGYAPTTLTI